MAFAKKIIDGFEYEFRPMNPLLVLEHGSKLTSELAGPAIEKLTQIGRIEANEATMMAVTAALVAEALKKMSSPHVHAAIMSLFEYATAKETKPDAGAKELSDSWKSHFLGKTKSMMAFIAWGMEVQFGDFFVGLGAQLTGVLKERFALLASQTEPKG